MKERCKTDDFFSEFDASVGRMEEYVKALEVETCERASLLGLLEQADLFYDAQRGEFKVVWTVRVLSFVASTQVNCTFLLFPHVN